MQDKDYLIRCLHLAKLSGKSVRPNPHVGAVIVYNDRIIGEGFHEKYGGPHAEVNAINSVLEKDKIFLIKSTIYVSLEPCCHTGNTPPCTDLIIKNKIPRVCIAEVDPSDKVNSKGIQILRQNGIEVNVIEIPTNELTAPFKVNQLLKRPYIQLKFAKSKDNYIGYKDKQIWLSNETSKVFTHKLRAYTDAVLIGTNTAIIDNPALTLRAYPGNAPARVVLDRTGRIPIENLLLSDSLPCIIFTENVRPLVRNNKRQIKINFSSPDFINTMLLELYRLNIFHVMIEGGATILKAFISANLWEEAVIIQTPKVLNTGIKAPNINGRIRSTIQSNEDQILIVENPTHEF